MLRLNVTNHFSEKLLYAGTISCWRVPAWREYSILELYLIIKLLFMLVEPHALAFMVYFMEFD